MRHWQKLAALFLAAACSGDATAPDASSRPIRAAAANRAPVATADGLPAQRLPGPGEAVAVAVGAYFTDPDGDALTFAAASADTAVVSATVAGDTVRLTGGGTGGAATVTVTAADPSGLSATVAVAVAVNRAPALSGEIPAQSLMAGDASSTVVSDYFDDPDGDALAFEASSTDPAVVRVAFRYGRWGTALTIRGAAVGEAAVTVTASDPDSLEARAVFTVEVTENLERAALVALYEATDGPNWKNNENWLTDAPLGEWHGVHAFDGAYGEVLSLNLSDNALSGPIPPELGNLDNLYFGTLDLSRNALSGPIPPELGNLASLDWLVLDRNALSGPIPRELANLANLRRLTVHGNPDLCAPADPQLRAWLIELEASPYPCPSNPDVRLLSLALMRADGNGLSLRLPSDLRSEFQPAVSVSDPGVVAATVADGWLVLEPRSIGAADVELVPSGGGSPAVAGVVVREAVGTFGIDIVMDRPAPLGYAETMVAAADWWSSVLDGTEWEDRRPGCYSGQATALADELLIQADNAIILGSHPMAAAVAQPCFFPPSDEDSTTYEPAGGRVSTRADYVASQNVARHEIGHILGLVLWPPRTGLTTEDGAHFTGPRAVEAFRAGGGDPGLPGVPLVPKGWQYGHWDVGVELMGVGAGSRDGLSLAALADAGYTVNMTKATPWRKVGNAAAAVAAEPFRDVVEVRIVPRPVPE